MTEPRLRALMLIALCAAATSARSQEIEPRALANTPTDLNFLIASYTYSEGGLATDPSLPLDNAQLAVHGGVLAYARSFELWSRNAKVNVVAPYASLSGSADFGDRPIERNVSGWADPRMRLTVNLVGAPAMSLAEIAAYQQDLIVGVSVEARAPLGQYDQSKVVNLGANRWAVKSELGASKALGSWIIELVAGASFYEDNDEYLSNRTREQAPIFSAQCSVIYSFPRGAWISVGATYYNGGRTRIDGVRGDDLQENSRIGVVAALPINRRNSIKLYANSGVSVRTGTDFDTAGIAWQHQWGEGL